MQLLVNGSRLNIGKSIGKGGEGEVFIANNLPNTAVKIYSPKLSSSREDKVTAMVSDQLASNSNLISYPKEVVKNPNGEFVGFTMNIVENHNPIHQLYGVKSRKNLYPKADFRFLLRAATNVARAVGQVHKSSCVIGDLNHSGILVSENATVALIDADSFQFEHKGKRYPCLVGVPDFTPPELHGSSLNGVTRTREHDYFGLAVAIFQLLFMGRHPYAGRYSGKDLSLGELIAQNRFAYSIRRKTGVIPPPAMITLSDYPEKIINAFEDSFGTSPNQRLEPNRWIELLTDLEGKLTKCSAHNMHFYPSSAKECPWCRVESLTGAILFIGLFNVSNATTFDVKSFDIDKIWAEIERISLPKEEALNHPPVQNIKKPEPTEEARLAQKSSNKLQGIIIAVIVLGLWAYIPSLTIIWLAGLWFAWSRYNTSSLNELPWKEEYSKAGEQYEQALERWKSRIGIGSIYQIKSSLENAEKEYKNLPQEKALALKKLQEERKERQLNNFLDKYSLRNASISGIGPAKTVTLISYGIETAADVTKYNVMSVPGFGPATADKLIFWRKKCERGFRYNSAMLPEDVQAKNKIEAEFSNKAKTLVNRLIGGKAELSQTSQSIKKKLKINVPELSNLYKKKLQAEVNLEFLGISKPYKSKFSYTSVTRPSQTTYRTPQRTSSSNTPNCPQCGSRMIRRTAKRGRNIGGKFWGCSRFPRCRGTRS